MTCKTAWHFAADWSIVEALDRVWEWAKMFLNRDALNNKLFLDNDEGENTVLPYSLICSDVNLLERIQQLTEIKNVDRRGK